MRSLNTKCSLAGMSPEQIVQVLEAGSSSKRKKIDALNQTVEYAPRGEA